MARRRRFGTVRKLPSGRWQARYRDALGERLTAPNTFATKADAQRWLSAAETDMRRGEWHDPRLGRRRLRRVVRALARHQDARTSQPSTVDLYRYLLRRHVMPHFGRCPSADHRRRGAGLAGRPPRHRPQPQHRCQGLPPAQGHPRRRRRRRAHRSFALHAQGRRHRTPRRDARRHPRAGRRPRRRRRATLGGARLRRRLLRSPLGRARRAATPRRRPRPADDHRRPQAQRGERAPLLRPAQDGRRPAHRRDSVVRRPTRSQSTSTLYAEPGDDGLVFPALDGGPMRRSNFRRRVWEPATDRAPA